MYVDNIEDEQESKVRNVKVIFKLQIEEMVTHSRYFLFGLNGVIVL